MMTVVAEIGASHGHSLEACARLIQQVRSAGADYIKLQTYTPDTISFPGAGICPSGPWKGQNLYDLYAKAHMPRDLQHKLITWMDQEEIPWFSTPFSPEDVDFLEEHECPQYKVSSYDVFNKPLLAAVRSTGKPVVISDGMMRKGLPTFTAPTTVLRCVSDYPADEEDYGLGQIHYAAWGVSDHTTSSVLGAVAAIYGAQMIEKHVRLAEDTTGPDAGFAIDPDRLEMCVAMWRQVERIATSTREPERPLADIMPRPLQIDGRRVWRRCTSAAAERLRQGFDYANEKRGDGH